MRYKDEEYGGRRIVFFKGKGGIVFAQTPSISIQYIGVGRNKEQAFEDAKKVIDKFNFVNKKIKESKSILCKYEDLPTDDNVEEYRRKGEFLRIYVDENPESPREWDNLGIMITSHSRYNLGDEQINASRFDSRKDFIKYLVEEKGALKEHIYPLYLYDHSGISISMGSFVGRAPHAEWDSGVVGYIYTTKEKLAEIGTPKDRIKQVFKGEVETYNQYLTGEVYGFKKFECENGNWEDTDSVWGFYGSDIKENGIEEHAGKGWRIV